MYFSKGLRRFICFILTILIVFFVFLGNGIFLVLSADFYFFEFEKLDVYSSFNDTNVPKVSAIKLIEYFKSDDPGLPDIEAFSLDQKMHLMDVKTIVEVICRFLLINCMVIFGLVVLLFTANKKGFLHAVGMCTLLSGVVCFVVTAVFAVLARNFDWVFIKFHEILFPQGNWTFPIDSNLIKMFPKQFFVDSFVVILKRIVVQSVILCAFGMILMRKRLKLLGKKQKIFKCN